MAVNYRGRMKARIETKKNYPFKWVQKCPGTQRSIQHLLIVSSLQERSHIPRFTQLRPALSEQWGLLLYIFLLPSIFQVHFNESMAGDIVQKAIWQWYTDFLCSLLSTEMI
jgi:hypothetical protein